MLGDQGTPVSNFMCPSVQAAGLPELIDKARTEFLALRLPRPVNNFKHSKPADLISLQVNLHARPEIVISACVPAQTQPDLSGLALQCATTMGLSPGDLLGKRSAFMQSSSASRSRHIRVAHCAQKQGVLCAATQADQHIELACIGTAVEEPRSIGAFRLARASFDDPASASASEPRGAMDRHYCGSADASSASEGCDALLQQALPSSAGREGKDKHESRVNAPNEEDVLCPRALQREAAGVLQGEQQPSTNSSRVLAERAAPKQNAQCESEPSQQPCPETSDLAEACCATSRAQCSPELDMSPAWRRAMQCLSETGLTVFCPSKRRRVSAQL